MTATSYRRALPAIALIAAILVLAGCQALSQSDGAEGSGSRGKPQGHSAHDPAATAEPTATPAEDEATPTGGDLWAAIRADFVLDHEIEHPRVRAEIAGLTRYPRHLLNMRERLELYLPDVYAQIAERGLPAELALLPILESGMNPHATALGGPTGLWQFIPATADRLDLPRNWWFDGRRDPALSTRAALDYLEYLYSEFDDWRLAIVSYNTGEGTVTRALQGRKEPVSFWSLRLPRAGMVFVPKLLALAEIVAHPERYGITLPELDSSPTFVTVATGGQVDISAAANTLGIDEETLYLLNPALNRATTPPDGPHQLNVPPARAEMARDWLAGLDHQERVQQTGEQQVGEQQARVRIRTGDSLSVIASRHGTDVRTLRQLNNLPDDRLRAGQYLVVPETSARKGPSEAAAVARAPVPSGAVRSHAGAGHVVRSGDTLWGIARAYRVPVDRLVAANRLNPGKVLKIGQRLVIPGAGGQAGR